jgi:hypothetical protein
MDVSMRGEAAAMSPLLQQRDTEAARTRGATVLVQPRLRISAAFLN